jgi:effector-binding domain-containing protein
MKIIKYVLLLIFLFSIAVTVFIATQEGKYDIKREKVINVPQPLLYDFINDYRNWENVGILTNNDTTATFAYSGSTSGKGAVSTWRLKDTEGRIETIKAMENDTLIQKAVIDGLPADILWTFRKVNGGTKVTVSLKGELGFSDKANAAFKGGVEEKFEEALDEGLNNLNTFLTHELTAHKVEVKGRIRKLGTYYLCSTATSSIPEMNRRVTEILPKLMEFIKENKIVTTGSPFAIFKTYDKQSNKTTFKVCIPIKEEIFTAPGSEIEGGRLETFEAFKTTLHGYYSHLPEAWTKAHDTIAASGISENTAGPYIEVYTRNVTHTKKPSQWVTDIYIPIGSAPVPVTPAATMPESETAASGTTTSTSPAASQPATRPATTTARPNTGNTTTRPAGGTGTTTQPHRQRPRTTTPATGTSATGTQNQQ